MSGRKEPSNGECGCRRCTRDSLRDSIAKHALVATARPNSSVLHKTSSCGGYHVRAPAPTVFFAGVPRRGGSPGAPHKSCTCAPRRRAGRNTCTKQRTRTCTGPTARDPVPGRKLDRRPNLRRPRYVFGASTGVGARCRSARPSARRAPCAATEAPANGGARCPGGTRCGPTKRDNARLPTRRQRGGACGAPDALPATDQAGIKRVGLFFFKLPPIRVSTFPLCQPRPTWTGFEYMWDTSDRSGPGFVQVREDFGELRTVLRATCARARRLPSS